MKTGAAVRLTAALLAVGFAMPSIASAEARTTYLSWSSAPITVRAALGAETIIAFGKNEQITYASVDDAVRWDAHEAPAVVADGAQVQRVAVTPSEASATNMLVRTTERVYHLHLQGVQAAPSQVAFVYARTFISRAVTAMSPIAKTIFELHTAPAPPKADAPAVAAPQASSSITVNPAPPRAADAIPQLVETVTPPAVAHAASTVAIGSITPTDVDAKRVTVAAPALKDTERLENPCPGAQKVTNTIRTFQYVSQATDALVLAKALKGGSLRRAAFGPHTLPFFLGELALESFVVHQAMKRACLKPANADGAGSATEGSSHG